MTAHPMELSFPSGPLAALNTHVPQAPFMSSLCGQEGFGHRSNLNAQGVLCLLLENLESLPLLSGLLRLNDLKVKDLVNVSLSEHSV